MADLVKHEVKDGDILVMYSDGFADNIFLSGTYQCLEEFLEDGIMTSLGGAAECLALKAHWLGKNLEYLSPFSQEWRKAIEAGDEFATMRWDPAWGSPAGGKHDDVTVTVAQIFQDKEGEPRKGTAAADKHFKESKKVYKTYVPSNMDYKRARFDTN